MTHPGSAHRVRGGSLDQARAASLQPGRWEGHAGMERFFHAMARTWAVFEMAEQRFLAAGDVTVVLTHVHATARATRRELDFPILQTLAIAGGRIREVRPFYWDTAVIADACRAPG